MNNITREPWFDDQKECDFFEEQKKMQKSERHALLACPEKALKLKSEERQEGVGNERT